MKSNQPFWILCILSALPGLDWPGRALRRIGRRGAAMPRGVPSPPNDCRPPWPCTGQLQLPTPRPAWPDDQGKMRFDASYEPVVARGHLFVPSMVDDSVAAYRLADGALVWRFYAEGPVRFAPVVHGDRVLFVSDDGYLYCVAADRGSLMWKLRGGPQDREYSTASCSAMTA